MRHYLTPKTLRIPLRQPAGAAYALTIQALTDHLDISVMSEPVLVLQAIDSDALHFKRRGQ